MTQVWLVLIAMFLWRTSRDANTEPAAALLGMSAFGFVIMSIVLFFVNGGTTG